MLIVKADVLGAEKQVTLRTFAFRLKGQSNEKLDFEGCIYTHGILATSFEIYHINTQKHNNNFIQIYFSHSAYFTRILLFPKLNCLFLHKYDVFRSSKDEASIP